MTTTYRKTATIEATQWFKMGDHHAVVLKSDPNRYADEGLAWCPTMEGGHIVTPGDWIATGIKGEHWPIKPDVFAETYTPVDALAARPAPQPAAENMPDIVRRLRHMIEGLDGFEMSPLRRQLWRRNLEIAAASLDQPAADTRVVTVLELNHLANTAAECGLSVMAKTIRAIIGTATPAQSDKIAEAARVLLGWWNQDTPDNVAMETRKVIRVMKALCENDDDRFEQFDAALRALVGKGE